MEDAGCCLLNTAWPFMAKQERQLHARERCVQGK
jgi:hypothetical protein